ncbi:polysaccharide deacetylase family protein [Henriciella aquimarina]|uniref:polysaccharide deacetylase family protein n=1 Tax=Henriciella aquimarina TaxID=545261 RepID=UPI000A057AFD|nr:polysaccharide deacetylase family protein [Henriciella aquimarina]
MRIAISILAVIGFFAIVTLAAILFEPKRMDMSQALEGPRQASAMPAIAPSDISDYETGSESRLAVLITDEASNWLGLAHGLKTIGVPFIITTDHDRALRHDVVLVYPMVSGRLVPAETLRALARFPQNGGTLIAANVLGGGLAPVFGFEGVSESKSHTHLVFDTRYAITSDFAELGHDRIRIGSETSIETNPGTNAYLSPAEPPVARYEDGSAAIVKRSYSDGTAYALGIDLGQLLLKGYNYKETNISEAYANQYQPTLDTLLRLISAIYREGDPDSVILGTVPDGKSLSVMMTHDVDYRKSVRNAVHYAEMEKEKGVRSTYFIQTKYMNDYNDETFLDDEGIEHVHELEALGVEIASHGVSHSLQFDKFDLGTGTEAIPAYQPFVRTAELTQNASIMGELRVSKFILETVTDNKVRAFRPGYLRIPQKLPEALLWSGYAYSSSVTANKSLTHFPFKLMASRGFEKDLEIFEFPITIEDELPPLMGERLEEAKAIADRLAAYGATMVILSHPDILDHKFDFAEGFIEHVKPFAWIGTISEFGAWWAARDKVGVDVVGNSGQKAVELSCPTRIEGLTLLVPRQFGLPGSPTGGAVTTAEAGSWLLDCEPGGMRIPISGNAASTSSH